MFKIIAGFFYNNAVRPVICEGCIYSHVESSYDRIISLRGEAWDHKTILVMYYNIYHTVGIIPKIAEIEATSIHLKHTCLRGIDTSKTHMSWGHR